MSGPSQEQEKEAREAIAELRGQLDTIDESLMELVKRRMEVVGAIGDKKAEVGLGVFDRARERQVLDMARARAERAGLDPQVGEALMHTLIEASHRAQEARVHKARQGEAPRVLRFLIVGGRGLMGQRLTGAFEGRGHHVEVADKGDPLTPEIIEAADVVMVAVPMALAADVARHIAPHVRPDALLCDINSLKVEVCEVYRSELCQSEALGTHPMFGPTVGTLRRQKVVVCPVRPGPLAALLMEELEVLGMELIEATPEEHDKMMALVQVLVHFRTLVMGEALRSTGVSIARSLAFTSPIYRLELAVVGRLFDQDPQLYAEIEMQNPYGEEVRAAFIEAAGKMQRVIASGDRARFSEAFGAVSDYFDDFTVEAMALSDYVIEALVARA